MMIEGIVVGSVVTLVLLAVGVEVLSRLAKDPPRYLIWDAPFGTIETHRVWGRPSQGVSRSIFRAWWWFHHRRMAKAGVRSVVTVTTGSSNFDAADMGSPWDNSTETAGSKPR